MDREAKGGRPAKLRHVVQAERTAQLAPEHPDPLAWAIDSIRLEQDFAAAEQAMLLLVALL